MQMLFLFAANIHLALPRSCKSLHVRPERAALTENGTYGRVVRTSPEASESEALFRKSRLCDSCVFFVFFASLNQSCQEGDSGPGG